MFGREPALWLAFIQAAIALGVGFGLNVTSEQMALIMAFSAAGIGLWTRSQVVPNAKIEASGMDPKTLRSVFVALLLSGAMASTGCALFNASATEPERPVAATGIAISDGLAKARIATTDLYNAKAFPFDGASAKDKYAKVLGYFREAQEAGNSLADALALYHAQPSDTNAQKVAAIFSTLNTKWPQITEELGGSSLPGRLVSIVAEVNKLMAQVRGAFTKPTARRQQEVLSWV